MKVPHIYGMSVVASHCATVACSTVGLIVDQPWFGIGSAFVSWPLSALYLIQQRRLTRGHRSTEGDSGDTGAGDLPVSPFAGAAGTFYAFGASVYSGTTGTANTGVELPAREQAETIKGWKRARLVVSEGRLVFAPLARGSSYRVEGRAQCDALYGRIWYSSLSADPQPEFHEAPSANCSCGFYAVREQDEAAADLHGVVLLEVELYGRVIVHENGYRAERQRVLSVRVPRQCSSWLCATDAMCVALSTEEVAGYRGTSTRSVILPFCRDHAALTDHDVLHTPSSLSDIAALLGTEVRWAS